MATYVFAALFLGGAILLLWLFDRRAEANSQDHRHWLRGDRWVLGTGWRKRDQ